MNVLDQAEAEGRVSVTVPEVHVATNLGVSTIYRLCRSGELPSVKVGGRLLLPIAGLRELLMPTAPPDA